MTDRYEHLARHADTGLGADYPHMPGERRVLARLVADSARAEAAGQIKTVVTMIWATFIVLAGLAVGCLTRGSWTLGWNHVLGTALGVVLYGLGRIWWERRKLRRFIRTLAPPAGHAL